MSGSLSRGLIPGPSAETSVLHGGLKPRKSADDVWDVVCWCGWSRTSLETRDLAEAAVDEHHAARGRSPSKAAVGSKAARRLGESAAKPIVATSVRPLRKKPDRQQLQDPDDVLKEGEKTSSKAAEQVKPGDHVVMYAGRTVNLTKIRGGHRARCSACGWNEAAEALQEVMSSAREHLVAHAQKESRRPRQSAKGGGQKRR